MDLLRRYPGVNATTTYAYRRRIRLFPETSPPHLHPPRRFRTVSGRSAEATFCFGGFATTTSVAGALAINHSQPTCSHCCANFNRFHAAPRNGLFSFCCPAMITSGREDKFPRRGGVGRGGALIIGPFATGIPWCNFGGCKLRPDLYLGAIYIHRILQSVSKQRKDFLMKIYNKIHV